VITEWRPPSASKRSDIIAWPTDRTTMMIWAEALDVLAILERDTEVSALEPSTDTTRLHAETTTVTTRNQTVVVVNSGHVLCVITILAIQITNQPVALFAFRQVKLPNLRLTKRSARKFWTRKMQPEDHSVVLLA
jgi:hypothetical protein